LLSGGFGSAYRTLLVDLLECLVGASYSSAGSEALIFGVNCEGLGSEAEYL